MIGRDKLERLNPATVVGVEVRDLLRLVVLAESHDGDCGPLIATEPCLCIAGSQHYVSDHR